MSARGGRGKSGNSIAGRLRAVGAWRRSGDGRERRGLEEWSADVQSDPGVAGCQPPGSGRESELAAAPGGIRWLVPGACRILPSRVLGTRTTREENAGRGVAQPGRASDWGSEGRRFESCRPDQVNPPATTSCGRVFFGGHGRLRGIPQLYRRKPGACSAGVRWRTTGDGSGRGFDSPRLHHHPAGGSLCAAESMRTLKGATRRPLACVGNALRSRGVG